MFERSRRLLSVACSIAALAACEEANAPAPVEATDGVGQGVVARQVAVGAFTGHYDGATGELTFEMVEPEVLQELSPDGLATISQGLWCVRRVSSSASNNGVRLSTVLGSVQHSFDACGITSNAFIAGLGAFCADVQLDNRYAPGIVNPRFDRRSPRPPHF